MSVFRLPAEPIIVAIQPGLAKFRHPNVAGRYVLARCGSYEPGRSKKRGFFVKPRASVVINTQIFVASRGSDSQVENDFL